MNEMKFTKNVRAEIVKALKAAKPHLWCGTRHQSRKTEYICLALERVSRQHPTGVAYAKSLIAERLGRSNTLWGWLRSQGISQKQLTDDRVQQHRHAWVDQLIAEFSVPIQ